MKKLDAKLVKIKQNKKTGKTELTFEINEKITALELLTLKIVKWILTMFDDKDEFWDDVHVPLSPSKPWNGSDQIMVYGASPVQYDDELANWSTSAARKWKLTTSGTTNKI